MDQVLLLASEHLDKTAAAVRSLGPRVACALTPGEGPSVNPKHQANEDSLAALDLGVALAGLVADSHWGAGLGEALVRATSSELARLPAASVPSTPAALEELVRRLEARVAGERADGDDSETTFLVALARGRRVVWTSVADSHLYRVAGGQAVRVNHDLPLFAGGDLAAAEARGIRVFESGALDLAPGELILLASDGIDPVMSGLETPDVAAILGRSGSLEERVRALVERGRRAPSGGRDNLALVALAPA